MTFEFPRISDDRSTHDFPIYAQEEHCTCGNRAAHKVEDVTGPMNRHPFTAYLCCECFEQSIGFCGGTGNAYI